MFLFLDCETGGIGPEYSLLQTYLLITDDQFNPMDDLMLLTKPDDGIYKVCGEAMNVNRIDLKVHDTQALYYKEAGTKLYKWLQLHTNDGKDKLIVVGHNVKGDIDSIIRSLISRGTWDKFTSYRLRDTQTVACFLIDCGIIKNISGSLESLCKYFRINQSVGDDWNPHDAKFDTEMTLKVYQKLINLMNEIKNSVVTE